MKHIKIISIIIVLLLFLQGCCKDDDPPTSVDKVLLVYLAGDNNLSTETFEKLEAMRQGFRWRDDSRILIYQDSYIQTPRLLEIDSKNQIQTLQIYAEENSADAKVFKRVIEEAKEMYPQADFNLLVFSHGSGWLPSGTLNSPRSFIVDGESEMELLDFASAIPDNAFEHIILEMCFSAGIEVAYELRNKASYIIASSAEIVSPGFTPVYFTNINDLIYGNPVDFIKTAFKYFSQSSGYLNSATFSVIKTSELDPLAEFVREHCTEELSGISGIQYFDRYRYHLFFDFEDYCSHLLIDSSYKETLSRLVGNCIEWKAQTASFMFGYQGFVINKHSGLTSYILQNQYPYLNQTYKTLSWSKAIGLE